MARLINGDVKICDHINGCGRVYSSLNNNCPDCGNPEYFADHIPMTANDYIYDLEVYPNIFTLAAYHPGTKQKYLYEISDRKNQILELLEFLNFLAANGSRMVGYNNNEYDYLIIHLIMQTGVYVTNELIYSKSMAIINSEDKFEHSIWPSDRFIQQIDLLKIHHFDNNAKRTSLKQLEIRMRMDNVEDLPFEPGTVLEDWQKDELIRYNFHDVKATYYFYKQSKEAIKFRESLCEKYNQDFMNDNDTKIGEKILIKAIEEANPGTCFTRNMKGKRVKRQTFRDHIPLRDVIFPYVGFTHPEFQRIHREMMNTVVDGNNTKDCIKLECSINGLHYGFGTGGCHASLNNAIIRENDHEMIIDLDVASFYPNLAIVNQLYPEHLSNIFCTEYHNIYLERKKYDKKNPLNGALKLALNGTYGKSNDVYSVFYDPKFTMSITINGQLLLCMFAERLMTIPGLKVLQVNTDGLTVRLPREHESKVYDIKKQWEDFTCLELESVNYSAMMIRDVNNYMAVTTDGKIKRIGAYAHELVLDNPGTRELLWHKNHSNRVVMLAAEAALVRGEDIEDFITTHSDKYDFLNLIKVNRTDRLLAGEPGNEKRLQRITRGYISKNGETLTKVMPPIKKMLQDVLNPETGELVKLGNKAEIKKLERRGWVLEGEKRLQYGNERRNAVFKGYKVKDCNDINAFNWNDVDFDFYIAEASKLVQELNEIQ